MVAMSKNPLAPLGNNLGDYLKEQRESARLSVRQLSDLAGISNPYLSQIERGVKRPSAEILQQIAKGLQISAETLYVQAGLLDPADEVEVGSATRSAIRSDAALTSRQRQTLLDIYDSFVGASGEDLTKGTSAATSTRATASRPRAGTGSATKKTSAASAAKKKTSGAKVAARKKTSGGATTGGRDRRSTS